MIERIQAGEITTYSAEAVADTYERILEDAAAQFGTVVNHAADPANHPMVFHCTAGKDRTGLMAMLLLGALGVADEDIARDYELTTPLPLDGTRLVVLRPQLEAAGVDVEAVLPFLTAQATGDGRDDRHAPSPPRLDRGLPHRARQASDGRPSNGSERAVDLRLTAARALAQTSDDAGARGRALLSSALT